MELPRKNQILLFYCMESEDLARKVAAQSDCIQLQSINWRSFPDGFPNLFINNAKDIRGHHVAFLAAFSSPCVIFEQLSVIFALPRLFVASFTLVLPFFPTGSFERMEEEGDVATAFTMARILSNIPISRGGPTSIVIYDIHALQVCFRIVIGIQYFKLLFPKEGSLRGLRTVAIFLVRLVGRTQDGIELPPMFISSQHGSCVFGSPCATY